MRFLSILSTLALPLAVLGARKQTDRFAAAFSMSLPLKLDDNSFTTITKAPRDYAIAVLLTAQEPRFGCVACQDFQPEWEILGRSWQKGDKAGAGRLLLGTLDFLDGKATFQSLGLQHAPVLLLYAPTTGVNARADSSPIRYDFTAGYVLDSGIRLRMICLTSCPCAEPKAPTPSTPGSVATSLTAPNHPSSAPSTTSRPSW